MKKFIIGLSLIAISLSVFSQQDTVAPYKRFPNVPPFKLLDVDSTDYFSKADLEKNKPVLIMLFNPECDHCKHETEEIIKNMDELKNVQIVMATMMGFDQMKSFYEKYDLKRFANIHVGQDTKYTLPTFYAIRFLPYLAMYDKKGNLLNSFEGSMKIEDLINTFKQ